MKGLDRGDWRKSANVGPDTLCICVCVPAFWCISISKVCEGSDYFCSFKMPVCEDAVGAGRGQRLLMEEAG